MVGGTGLEPVTCRL